MGGPAEIDGETHHECDNFYTSPFVVDGVTYQNSEQYFQAAKCVSREDKERIMRAHSASEAWAIGNEVTLRSDWEAVKVNVMYRANKERLSQHPCLLRALLPTAGKVEFTGSTNFWNKWNGKIMELIRAEMRDEPGDSKQVLALRKEMRSYEESAAMESAKMEPSRKGWHSLLDEHP